MNEDTTKNTLWPTHIKRPTNHYWEITEYTSEEFDALLEADRLTPELAEHYKELLP
jgi:hypothetical protein